MISYFKDELGLPGLHLNIQYIDNQYQKALDYINKSWESKNTPKEASPNLESDTRRTRRDISGRDREPQQSQLSQLRMLRQVVESKQKPPQEINLISNYNDVLNIKVSSLIILGGISRTGKTEIMKCIIRHNS